MHNHDNRKQPRAVVLEDDINLAKAYGRVLESMRYEVTLVHSVADARLSIRDLSPELIIVDIGLPDGNGLDLMSELGASTRGRFIVISGDSSQRAAIKSIRHRAIELLIKPVSLKKLRSCLSSTSVNNTHSETGESSLSNRRAHGSGLATDYPGFWIDRGRSSALRELRTAASLSAESRRGHALIVGESGLEKCSIALAVHYRSRRVGECVIVDCKSSTSDTSTKGFFGAVDPASGKQIHIGHIERARGGTLVLEHVHCLPAQVQSALMSFLDSGHFRPLNGLSSISAVVAVIGITHRGQSESAFEPETLRADFRYRLAQTAIDVPTLSRCVGDLEEIANFVLADIVVSGSAPVRLSDSAISKIAGAHWNGNIAQLRLVIKESLSQHENGDELELVSRSLTGSEESREAIAPHIGHSVWELERQLLLGTLDYHSGDRKAAARTLGVSLKTLYNRLNAYAS